VIGLGLEARVLRGPLALVVLVLISSESPAQQIRVENAACGEPIRVVARDAPLSDVLKRIAGAMHFRVEYQAQSDPRITIDERSDASALVLRLIRETNFSMEQVRDTRCASAWRIANLAILSQRGEQRVAPARPAWQTPETERIAREGLSDYLRSHGMDDQPREALAVH
jgi:hypothetical protein